MAKRILSPEIFANKATEVRKLKDEQKQIIQRLTYLVSDPEILEINEQIRNAVGTIKSMGSTLDNFAKILEGYAELMDTYANRFAVTVYASPKMDRFR